MEEREMVKLSFTGDILCYESQNELAHIGEDKFDFSYMLEPIKGLLKDTDYLCGSLETPLAGKNAIYTNHSKVFNTPDDFAKYLKVCGFNHLTTANNHCLDRGIDGLDRTIQVLDQLGIEHTGTYNAKAENDQVFVKDIMGMKIAILSFTYGTNSRLNKHFLSEDQLYKVDLLRAQERPGHKKVSMLKRIISKIYFTLKPPPKKELKPVLDNVPPSEIQNPVNKPYINRFVKKIQKAKEVSDLVILCLHSGGQFNFNEGIGDYTKYIIDLASENHADIIIGNHAHCVLPSKFNKNNKFISYALGNFCFTPGEGYYINDVLADYSVLVNVFIDVNTKTISKVEFSVLKSIREIDGRTKVYSVYDLFKVAKTPEEKNAIKQDVLMVTNKFMNTDLKSIDILKTYTYPISC